MPDLAFPIHRPPGYQGRKNVRSRRSGNVREVVEQIIKNFHIKQIGEPDVTIYGRKRWTLSIGFGECAIDLSFTPVLAFDSRK